MANKTQKHLQENHTPEVMTKLISAKLDEDLKVYGNFSNAYLATFPEHIEGPVWCMDLYIGEQVHIAILEEFTLELAIYTGPLRPQIYFPDNQKWDREEKEVRRYWELYKNSKKEYCLRYSCK